MRLLDTETGQFVEKDPEETRYAILSHTWDKQGEQTYEELIDIQRRNISSVQRRRMGPEGGTSSPLDSKNDQHGSSQPLPPQPPSDPSSPTTHPLVRLTQSEVEASLFRQFVEVYGLPNSTPAPSDHSAPATEPQAMKPPQPESIWDDPDLSPKIRDACAVARKNGYRYIWIDSWCCRWLTRA